MHLTLLGFKLSSTKYVLWDIIHNKPWSIVEIKTYIDYVVHIKCDSIIALSTNRSIIIWDYNLDRIVKTIDYDCKIYALDAFDDGRIICACADNSIRIWNFLTNEIQILCGHKTPINSIKVFSENMVASLAEFEIGTIKIWDAINETLLTEIQLKNALPYFGMHKLNFSANFSAKHCVATVDDYCINVYNLDGEFMKKIDMVLGHDVYEKAITTIGSSVFGLLNVGTICKHDFETNQTELVRAEVLFKDATLVGSNFVAIDGDRIIIMDLSTRKEIIYLVPPDCVLDDVIIINKVKWSTDAHWKFNLEHREKVLSLLCLRKYDCRFSIPIEVMLEIFGYV